MRRWKCMVIINFINARCLEIGGENWLKNSKNEETHWPDGAPPVALAARSYRCHPLILLLHCRLHPTQWWHARGGLPPDTTAPNVAGPSIHPTPMQSCKGLLHACWVSYSGVFHSHQSTTVLPPLLPRVIWRKRWRRARERGVSSHGKGNREHTEDIAVLVGPRICMVHAHPFSRRHARVHRPHLLAT